MFFFVLFTKHSNNFFFYKAYKYFFTNLFFWNRKFWILSISIYFIYIYIFLVTDTLCIPQISLNTTVQVCSNTDAIAGLCWFYVYLFIYFICIRTFASLPCLLQHISPSIFWFFFHVHLVSGKKGMFWVALCFRYSRTLNLHAFVSCIYLYFAAFSTFWLLIAMVFVKKQKKKHFYIQSKEFLSSIIKRKLLGTFSKHASCLHSKIRE